MIVREVRLRGVTKHADTRLTLPARGLVVITGDNGSGKSSLIEGVALAAYGRTLRGAPVWLDGGECSAELETDRISVVRSRSKGGRGALSWSHSELQPVPWESVTRAQEALERELPPWDAWRRGCVFSSSDAAHFSTASDAERKRLVESVLGVDVFDGAVEACRKDLRAAHSAVASAQGDRERERRTLLATTDRRHAARRALEAVGLDPDALSAADRVGGLTAVTDVVYAALPVPPPAEELAAQLDKLQDVMSSLDEDLRAAEKALDTLSNVGGVSKYRATDAAKLVRQLSSGVCPTCRRGVPHEHLDGLNQEAERASALAADEAAAADAQREPALALFEELAGDRSLLVRRVAEARAAVTSAETVRSAQVRSRVSAMNAWAEYRTCEIGVQGLAEAEAEASARCKAASRDALLLEAAESALGLRGVRAHVLRRGLSALNAVASAWLPRLGLPDLTVEVRPYSERKSGGVVDAVDVVLGGAGAGHGYRAASAGERRRVDVALLLGVAELACAASGSSGSTLFFDELFDGLDTSGRAAAASALADLAADRAVVLVTHDQDLAARLPAAKRVHVSEGRVL
jgi:DNA repair exonuclease SbcCD ATPase subunit